MEGQSITWWTIEGYESPRGQTDLVVMARTWIREDLRIDTPTRIFMSTDDIPVDLRDRVALDDYTRHLAVELDPQRFAELRLDGRAVAILAPT